MPYTSDKKITQLDSLGTPASNDLFVIGDVSNAGRAKSATFTAVAQYITTIINSITGGNKVNATATDTTADVLDEKIEIVSSDGSVIVSKTIQNSGGDEKISYDLAVISSGSSSGGGTGGKPMTFSITDTDISAQQVSRAGYIDREALFTREATTKFTLQDAEGYTQTRDFTSDWAAADTVSSYILIGSDLYVLLLDAGGSAARIYLYDATDLSAGGAQVTVSGATLTYNANLVMTSNGVHAFINYENGASANAYRISKFTLGTTFTFVSAVNCGATATRFDSTFAVNSDGSYYGIASGILYRYSITGALTYTSGQIVGVSSAESILNWANTMYLNSDSDPLYVKMYLPDTEIDSSSSLNVRNVTEFDDFTTGFKIMVSDTSSSPGYILSGNFAFQDTGASTVYQATSELDHPGIVNVDGSNPRKLQGFYAQLEDGLVVTDGLLFFGNDFDITVLARTNVGVSYTELFELTGSTSTVGLKITDVGSTGVYYNEGAGYVLSGTAVPSDGWHKIRFVNVGGTITIYLDTDVVFTGAMTATDDFGISLTQNGNSSTDIDYVLTNYKSERL